MSSRTLTNPSLYINDSDAGSQNITFGISAKNNDSINVTFGYTGLPKDGQN
jgi:hypothetical protein